MTAPDRSDHQLNLPLAAQGALSCLDGALRSSGCCQRNGAASGRGCYGLRMSRKSRAKPPNPFRCFNSSPEVIRLVVMMYVRFPLSLRNVEDLLFERGIDICH